MIRGEEGVVTSDILSVDEVIQKENILNFYNKEKKEDLMDYLYELHKERDFLLEKANKSKTWIAWLIFASLCFMVGYAVGVGAL